MYDTTIETLIQFGYREPQLRNSLRPIIAHYKLASVRREVLGGAQRAKYIDDVYDMTVKTYQKIGIKLASPHELLDYDLWWVFLNDEGKPIAFTVFKRTPFGLKAGLSGSDLSIEGKGVAVNELRKRFHDEGIYGEVSHNVEGIVLAANAPKIPNIYAEAILNKPILKLHDDGYHYDRNLKGVGVVTKIMVGKPDFNFNKEASFSFIDDTFVDIQAHYSCAFSPFI